MYVCWRKCNLWPISAPQSFYYAHRLFIQMLMETHSAMGFLFLLFFSVAFCTRSHYLSLFSSLFSSLSFGSCFHSAMCWKASLWYEALCVCARFLLSEMWSLSQHSSVCLCVYVFVRFNSVLCLFFLPWHWLDAILWQGREIRSYEQQLTPTIHVPPCFCS